MNKQRARQILKERNALSPDGGLTNGGWYLGWTPGNSDAMLDGSFTADELDAIAWWMRNAEPKEGE